MIKVHRLQEVLSIYKSIVLKKIDLESYDDFMIKVIDEYIEYYNDEDKMELNEHHMAFAVPAIAIYSVLVNHYQLSKEDAIELIYQLTYRATEKIFDDLSFVQMAYYLICNKPFLKQLMLRSLSEFNPIDIEDSLVEHELNHILDKDLDESTMVDYFINKGKPELKELAARIEMIIEEFVDTHFSKHQKKFTIEDFY
ncbi:hypothetical protein [Vallitalea okinawensis]|uniref:hypothetical protein n=1 Tax=Vallitalea okinawensis TaxID=2078660 RepID=UPI000CFDCA92|nr:hypothetical protein [Vallitalea okinawensis]